MIVRRLLGEFFLVFLKISRLTMYRQRRYFYYLSGCELPDSYLTYDFQSEKLTLFIPPVVPEEVIWSGLPMSVEEAKQK